MNIDLVAEIRKRKEKIEKLEEEISVLEKVAEMFGESGRTRLPPNVSGTFAGYAERANYETGNGELTKSRKFGESKFIKPIGDAVVEILTNENVEGMHLAEIQERLLRMGIAPTPSSLDAALRKDHKERFKRVATKTYGLKN